MHAARLGGAVVACVAAGRGAMLDAETHLEMSRSIAAALLGLLALLVALAAGGGVERVAEIARITFACVLVFGPLLAFGGLVARIAHGDVNHHVPEGHARERR